MVRSHDKPKEVHRSQEFECVRVTKKRSPI